MANKRGMILSGQEVYAPMTLTPILQASIATGNAGGAAVAAQYLSLSALGGPMRFDFRICQARGDRAFSGGNLLFKIMLNGSPVNSGALAPSAGLAFNVVAPQTNPWEVDSPNNPGLCTIDHGDVIGWTVQALTGFACTGTMTITLHMWGATAVQPSFKAWAP